MKNTVTYLLQKKKKKEEEIKKYFLPTLIEVSTEPVAHNRPNDY